MACSDITFNEICTDITVQPSDSSMSDFTVQPSAKSMSDVTVQPSATSMSDVTAQSSTRSISDTLEVCEKDVVDTIPESPVIGADALGQLDKPTVDNVCNLANLFSGELERRRKQEATKLMAKNKRLKRSHRSSDTNSGDIDDNSGVSQSKKPVLNYFVALQISNIKIKDALQKVQESIVSKHAQLSRAVTNVSKLHLTLMMLSLPSEEDMRKSQVALDNAAQRLLPLHSVSPLILDISGLGHFGHQVVFAKVKKDDQLESLQNIASVVEESFLDQQIVSPDKKGFKPHATIMKMSQMKGWQRKGLKKIDADLYTEFVDGDFGSDTINTLQICALGKPKDKHGYYHVEYSALFGKPFADESIADTSETNIVDTITDTAVGTALGTAASTEKDTGVDLLMNTAVDITGDSAIDGAVDTGETDIAIDGAVDTGETDIAIDNVVSYEASEDNNVMDTEVD